MKTKTFGIITGVIIILGLAYFGFGIQPTFSGTLQITKLKVAPRSTMDLVQAKATGKNKLNPADLVEYANTLIQTEGFTYEFDGWRMVENQNKKSSVTSIKGSSKKLVTYQATQKSGAPIKLEMKFDPDPTTSLCDEQFFPISCSNVTKQEIHLLHQGQTYTIKRNQDFFFEEVALLDPTLKKVQRTWVMPFQAVPVGISPDQTKVYLECEVDNLLLELSESGIAFRLKSSVKLTPGQGLENPPTDAENEFLSFLKFKHGKQVSILRFSGPCT
ncbi:MAG: hypothetical protein HY774_14490 [Acidobacteria bacterium]|nr:hypothetical protein [Acidobacteriota bacterium]